MKYKMKLSLRNGNLIKLVELLNSPDGFGARQAIPLRYFNRICRDMACRVLNLTRRLEVFKYLIKSRFYKILIPYFNSK
jgi:hypothetical protein